MILKWHSAWGKHLGRTVLTIYYLVIGAVIGSVVTLVVQSYGPGALQNLFGSPARLGEQLDSIAHSAGTEGYVISWHRYARGLHSGREQSLLMKLSDVRDAFEDDSTTPRPDEFRIYDLKEFPSGEPALIERFRFRPKPTFEVGALTEWRFNVRRVADLSNGGQVDIIADFSENRGDESTRRPVIIYWDAQRQKYVVRALISKPPDLASFKNPGVRTAGYQKEYTQAEHLVDDRNGTSVTPYATTAYTVCGDTSGVATVAAYWISEGGPGKNALQLSGSFMPFFDVPIRALYWQSEEPYIWRLAPTAHFPSESELEAKARRLISCHN